MHMFTHIFSLVYKVIDELYATVIFVKDPSESGTKLNCIYTVYKLEIMFKIEL